MGTIIYLHHKDILSVANILCKLYMVPSPPHQHHTQCFDKGICNLFLKSLHSRFNSYNNLLKWVSLSPVYIIIDKKIGIQSLSMLTQFNRCKRQGSSIDHSKPGSKSWVSRYQLPFKISWLLLIIGRSFMKILLKKNSLLFIYCRKKGWREPALVRISVL